MAVREQTSFIITAKRLVTIGFKGNTDMARVKRQGTEIDANNVIAQQQQLIKRLSEGYIYYKVKNLPTSKQKHWHQSCVRLQLILNKYSYNKALEFQKQMNTIRKGKYYSYKKDVKDEYRTRDL
jgi:hypothetical protein